jgi:hypothetical protein
MIIVSGSHFSKIVGPEQMLNLTVPWIGFSELLGLSYILIKNVQIGHREQANHVTGTIIG